MAWWAVTKLARLEDSTTGMPKLCCYFSSSGITLRFPSVWRRGLSTLKGVGTKYPFLPVVVGKFEAFSTVTPQQGQNIHVQPCWIVWIDGNLVGAK